MIVIPIRVFGDHWVNTDEVIRELAAIPWDGAITLRMFTEGCSLHALGIVHCVKQLHNPAQVWVDQWPNSVESIPFHRTEDFRYSHFFWMSKRYTPKDMIPGPKQAILGFFMGRPCIPRQRILWDLYKKHPNRSLISIMSGSVPQSLDGYCPDTVDSWVSPEQIWEFQQWWDDPPISSIDGHTIRDQYDVSKNTNRSLLEHYNKFDIEIVSETYTRGDCYFVTEKTVRPISAGKPFLLYGPKNFLQRLQQQGFRTWARIWDESYDQYEGPKRWHHMQTVIQHIIDLSHAEFLSVLESALEVAEHNRRHLQTIIDQHGPTE